MRKDLCNSITPVQVIAAGTVVDDNTAQVGEVVDSAGFESVTYVINVGAACGAVAATFTPSLKASATGAFAGEEIDVTDDYLIGSFEEATFTGADGALPGANKMFKFGYLGILEFTKLTITPAGNNAAADFSVTAILGHATVQPTDNPPGSGTPGT